VVVLAVRFRFSSFFTLGLIGDSSSNSQGCVRGPLKVNVAFVGAPEVPEVNSPPIEWTRRCLVRDGVVLAILAEVGRKVEVELVEDGTDDDLLAYMARAR